LDARWDTLSVDFVVELLESSGHDAVMTVVDSVSKRVHFVPMHTMVTVEGAARLFLHYVWKLHSLPKRVVLDRGPQFVASFRIPCMGFEPSQVPSGLETVNEFTERMKFATEETKLAICKV